MSSVGCFITMFLHLLSQYTERSVNCNIAHVLVLRPHIVWLNPRMCKSAHVSHGRTAGAYYNAKARLNRGGFGKARVVFANSVTSKQSKQAVSSKQSSAGVATNME